MAAATAGVGATGGAGAEVVLGPPAAGERGGLVHLRSEGMIPTSLHHASSKGGREGIEKRQEIGNGVE